MTITAEAWKVLAGACLVFITTTPYLFVFEILYNQKLESFQGNVSTNSTLNNDHTLATSWTFTIYLMMWNFISLFVGPLSQMRSHRWTTSVGIFLMSIGAILSSFAQSNSDIYLSVGLLSGSGQGLVTNTVILILVEHFQDKQGLALGISFMIMALSGILAPQVVKGLLNNFSDQVSINIVGGILFTGLLGSAFFYPAKIEDDSNTKTEGSNEAHETMLKNGNANQNESKKQSMWKKNPIVKMFLLINWKLLKSPHFVLTALGSSYSFNALLSFYVFLPLFAESYNYTISQKSTLLSIIAGIDLITRFLFAWIGDWKCTQTVFFNQPRRMLYALSVIGICIVMMSLPFCQSFNTVLAACVFYGIFAGGIPGNGPMVYSESFKEDLPSAMGIASIGRALSALSMGPLANIAKSRENGVQLSLWVTGGVSLFWMLIWILEIFLRSCRKKTVDKT